MDIEIWLVGNVGFGVGLGVGFWVGGLVGAGVGGLGVGSVGAFTVIFLFMLLLTAKLYS